MDRYEESTAKNYRTSWKISLHKMNEPSGYSGLAYYEEMCETDESSTARWY